jgi:hypothetical protein
MRNIEWTEGKKYLIRVGSRESQVNMRFAIEGQIHEHFGKRPAVMRDIYHALWARGSFDDWVEGFGVVTIVDREANDAYQKLVDKAVEGI